MDEWAEVALFWAVLLPAVVVAVVMAVAALLGADQPGREEFGRPGQAGPTPARDLVDLAGREVPGGR